MIRRFFGRQLFGSDRAARQLRIKLAHGSEAEARTRDLLLSLVAQHDLSHWPVTGDIVIDERAIPHSHPRLTLHTRHAGQPDRLLSTYLHEQIHWLVLKTPRSLDAVIAELRARYPAIPIQHPDGAGDERGTYLHLAVNYLELVAASEYLGRDAALEVFAFWVADHYRAIYATVVRDECAIGAIVRRHGLVPATHTRGKISDVTAG